MDYTPQQAAQALRLIPGAIQQAVETEQQLAILDMEADMKQRIFLDGERKDGTQIGKYSTRPTYISIEGARGAFGSQIPTSKLKARGAKTKGKKATFRIVNEDGERVAVLRRSMFFPGGYEEFRRLMGRDTSKVNLKLTGDMAGSIASGTERSVSTIAFTNEGARKKAEGNEEHFTGGTGTIFRAASVEIDRLTQRLTDAAQEALNTVLP